MRRTSKIAVILVMVLGFILIVNIDAPTHAAPEIQPTQFKTPTPGPDGRIFYQVQDQDTLWSIAAISGLSIDEIRALNNLHPNENIHAGQQLLLGVAGPALFTATTGPTQPLPTPTITPTPEKGTGKICILLYDDINGDSLRQEEEPSIPKGAINVSENTGKYTKSEDTLSGMDPNCYDNLPPGDYNISIAIPEGYNPTTETNYQLTLKAGDETYIDFGAQSKSSVSAVNTVVPVDGNTQKSMFSGTTPILGLFGGLFLLLGLGLFIYATRIRK